MSPIKYYFSFNLAVISVKRNLLFRFQTLITARVIKTYCSHRTWYPLFNKTLYKSSCLIILFCK